MKHVLIAEDNLLAYSAGDPSSAPAHGLRKEGSVCWQWMWRSEFWEFDRLGTPAEQQTWEQGQDCGLWGDFSTANSICIIIVLILIIIYNPHLSSKKRKKALKDGCSLFTTAP